MSLLIEHPADPDADPYEEQDIPAPGSRIFDGPITSPGIVPGLIAERAALQAENTRLQMELDASCSAEELRQTRSERDDLQAKVKELEEALAAADQWAADHSEWVNPVYAAGLEAHAEALAEALDGYQECCGEDHPRPNFDCETCGKEERVLSNYRAFRALSGVKPTDGSRDAVDAYYRDRNQSGQSPLSAHR